MFAGGSTVFRAKTFATLQLGNYGIHEFFKTTGRAGGEQHEAVRAAR